VIYKFSKLATVFAPGKPFQERIVFGGKAGVYPNETPFRRSTLG